MSLLDFLKEHYAKDHQDADQSEDDQLPFKNPGSLEITYALIPVPVTVAQGSRPAPQKQSLRSSPLINRQQDRVFHPPK